jgi:riboflavin synthase
MFTGIIEGIGIIKSIRKDGDNKIFEIQSSFSTQLKPDQSVSHNGVCLTITKKNKQCHFVTAVKETLQRSNLKYLSPGDEVNLERSMILGNRLDGHFVQGHVDTFSEILKIKDNKGSKELSIALRKKDSLYVVEKGSVCLNGISLTVSKLNKNSFQVAIIPYTLEHTNLKNIKPGDILNVEFDILGKYIHRILKN